VVCMREIECVMWGSGDVRFAALCMFADFHDLRVSVVKVVRVRSAQLMVGTSDERTAYEMISCITVANGIESNR
jgi:hypothetical protein